MKGPRGLGDWLLGSPGYRKLNIRKKIISLESRREAMAGVHVKLRPLISRVRWRSVISCRKK